ncbi:hypothetical protein TrST_g1948 [Triparma strigata]|uniref:Fe2OG dioxygenase domain-containing protein n=1 Tax=Triparma strigata TaxID=1606541 RepID=A0A9W7B6Q6_9STRA|nr:hypothetical protein TrST_g1948 [Triparma strigata]
MRNIAAVVVCFALAPHNAESLEDSVCEDLEPPIIDLFGSTLDSGAILDATLSGTGSGVFYLSNCGYLCDLMALESEGAFEDSLSGLFNAGRSDLSSWSSKSNSRGYIKAGGESGVRSKFYEVKEGYEYGCSQLKDDASRRNKWPRMLPQDTIVSLDSLFEELQALKNLLIEKVFAPYLNTKATTVLNPEDWERGRSIDLVRLFNYLECDNSSYLPELGSSPHTDWGLITIILQPPSSPPALQLHHPETGTWVDVPPKAGTVVVNAGDFLQILSHVNHEVDETFRSPLHRVQHCGDTGGARKSVVFFSYPRPEMSLHLIKNDIVKKVTKASRSSEEHHNTLLAEDYSKYDYFGDWINEKWKGVSTET